jgi:hypothetical protein
MDTSEDGRMFVTVGVRHVKFWYLEQASKSGSSPLQVNILKGLILLGKKTLCKHGIFGKFMKNGAFFVFTACSESL